MGAQPVAGTCPNPVCGAPIPVNHPYAWCSGCGASLPEALQAQLPKLQEVYARGQAAREGLVNRKPVSKERAAAGWGVLGILSFCAGAWSFFEEPNTGGAGVAFGSVSLLLAYQTHRGAPAIVIHTLQGVLAALWLVFMAFGILDDVRKDPELLYWLSGGLAVFGLYQVVRILRKSWAAAS